MEHGTTLMFEFPYLSSLTLLSMPVLSCFYPGKHHLECPLLYSLNVKYCPMLKLFTSNFDDGEKEGVIEASISPVQQPLFSIEILASSNLRILALNEENIMLLSDARLPQDLLYKLNNLYLCFEDDNNEKGTLPFDFFHKVPYLKILVVQKCFGLKEIFPSQKLQVHETLVRLKELYLFQLKELEWVGLEHPWVQPYSEKLEMLNLDKCPQVEKLVSSTVCFINLKRLFVMNCERMEYLFTFATFKSLVKLENLQIMNCESIKEIAKCEDEDGFDEMVFGGLRLIELNCLRSLVSFYSGNAILQFSCLEAVKVIECLNMETFSQGVIKAPSLLGIQTSKDFDLTFDGNLNITIQRLFHQKGFFNYSKLMILNDYLEMAKVQHKKPVISENFFGSFKKLEFDAACNRPIVIPSHVLPYLKNLEELNVHSSGAVQVIFDIDECEKGILYPLKKLILQNLPNLKCLWKENPRGFVSFPHLQEVVVSDCGNLVTLFSSSFAKNLEKLEKLYIDECEKLIEIVGKEDAMEHGTTLMFEFPYLSSLTLWSMPVLSCFYPGKHHLECPLLYSLHVQYCPKLKLFTSNFDDGEKEGVIEAPISLLQQPLFSVEILASPNLKNLILNEENIMLLSNARVPQDLLYKLSHLYLCFEDDNNEKETLPFDFFRKVPNLEYLEVEKCFGLKEIFPSQKIKVHDIALVRLQQLSLLELNELEWIGLEHPWVQPYCQKLEMLKLNKCPQVEKLVSSAVSFTNLQKLSVRKCERMEYLFTFATLKSLVKLESLVVEECESIKEIAKNEDEDDCDEMVFGRLRSIELNYLPCLVRFYSGNATLQCSYLKKVMVAKCPKMETFSEGVIKVSMFLGIKTSKDSSDLTFHGDLNTTIRQLFHKQVIHQS